MKYLYENPDIAEVLAKAAGLHLLKCIRQTRIMPVDADVNVYQIRLDDAFCYSLYAKTKDAPALILNQAVEDTPDNLLHMQSVLESSCLDLGIPGYDHITGNICTGLDNTYLRQAQELRQTYGSALKLGIFKGTSQSPLGWTTLDNLDVQDIIEFLERGYVLKPVD